jgi:hypothetical protein
LQRSRPEPAKLLLDFSTFCDYKRNRVDFNRLKTSYQRGAESQEGSLPGDEEDLAFLTVILGYEIIIKHSISAVVLRQLTPEELVVLPCFAHPLYYHNSLLIINLEDDPRVGPFCFQLHKLVDTIIVHSDA